LSYVWMSKLYFRCALFSLSQLIMVCVEACMCNRTPHHMRPVFCFYKSSYQEFQGLKLVKMIISRHLYMYVNVLVSACANNLAVITSLNGGHTHWNNQFLNVDLICSIRYSLLRSSISKSKMLWRVLWKKV